jgi:hypothetical protein
MTETKQQQELYPEIVKSPLNTPVGWSEPDPAIDRSEPQATFDPRE